MTPWLDDGDLRLYHGDAIDVLRTLPDGCVDMVATSPPFYGLRDYGTGTWEGGDPDCDHKPNEVWAADSGDLGERQSVLAANEAKALRRRGGLCHCGARRVDQQIGLEETPDQWVDRLVAVFRECRRVLADHGTLWVEIGDSYANGSVGRNDAGRDFTGGGGNKLGSGNPGGGIARSVPGHKPKDLLGQPWMLAFALRADGWFLRSEIIWARPNPMPESVTDRPTKAHSTVFLLSKQPRYYFDQDAIREPYSEGTLERSYTASKAANFMGVKAQDSRGRGENGDGSRPRNVPRAGRGAPQSETLDGSNGEAPRGPDGRRQTRHTGPGENSEQPRSTGDRWPNPTGANARSVWSIPTEPTPFAHFATWPQALVRRMILAGTSERGKCPECGKPWERETASEGHKPRSVVQIEQGRPDARTRPRSSGGVPVPIVTMLGWSPSCACDRDPVPCVVLDPFAGSGTTLLVARNHQRHAIGIDLSLEYLQLAARRLQQLSLLT